jgi:hypothetical protein
MSRRGGVGRAEHRAALDVAAALLAERLADLEFERGLERGAEARGTVGLGRPDGTIDPIEIGILFGGEFPESPPVAFDAAERWEPDDDRHIPGDHSFCLYLQEVDEPDVTTRRGLERWFLDLVVFLEQQLVYESTGRFPGPEWAHRQRAYAQYVLEVLETFPVASRANAWNTAVNGGPERNALCPCGAGRKTKRCHLDDLEELRRVARRAELATMTLTEVEQLRGS